MTESIPGMRQIVGTERRSRRLVFSFHCLSCNVEGVEDSMYGAREAAKRHVTSMELHRVLVGQVYLLKLVRTRWGGENAKKGSSADKRVDDFGRCNGGCK